MNKKKFLQSCSVYDLIFIAMLSAITIAIKTVIGILVRMITGPLGIPGGALAGGFYMLWLALGLAIVGKKGTAFFIALVQTIVLLITGLPGSHGVWTFLTYLAPAIVVELIFLFKKNEYNILHFILATVFANVLGTFGSNLLFFRMAALPLTFTLVAAAFSGCIGGVIGYFLYKKIDKNGLLKSNKNGLEELPEIIDDTLLKRTNELHEITDDDALLKSNKNGLDELPKKREKI